MNQTVQLVLFYIVIIGILFLPTYLSNKKKKKQKEEMINSLKVGSKVVTIGGIKGEISAVLTDSVELKIDKTARITILKSAISNISE